jgi:hypothetical protein
VPNQKPLDANVWPPRDEAKLRKLAGELRVAIKEHEMAKSSLSTKKAAISERDPDLKSSLPVVRTMFSGVGSYGFSRHSRA